MDESLSESDSRLESPHQVEVPQIRKRSFQNFPEYIYLVNCEDPLGLFLKYTEDQKVIHNRKQIAQNRKKENPSHLYRNATFVPLLCDQGT